MVLTLQQEQASQAPEHEQEEQSLKGSHQHHFCAFGTAA
jgi:hypothetical protein